MSFRDTTEQPLWPQLEPEKCADRDPKLNDHKKKLSIFEIAIWLGDDVRVVQKHYAKLSPKAEDIEKAFSASR